MATAQVSTKVLVVEDDPASIVMLEALIEALGFQAITVNTLADARTAIARHSPPIAIMDVMLPDGESTELLAEIRKARLPMAVALVTATHDPARLDKCETGDPDAMFGKPLDSQAIAEWLERQAGKGEE